MGDDRWMDERDREMRERDWRRSEQYGRGRGDMRRGEEERSWSADERSRYDDEARSYRGYGRDEEDYGQRSRLASGGAESYGRGGGGGRPPAYQSGQGGGYGAQPRFSSQDYTGAGRSYRDEAARESARPGYRADYGRGYGEGGLEYGREYQPDRGRGSRSGWASDGDRTYNRDLERRYAEDLRHRASGGTGGYDYERGYGDAGRSEQRGRAPWEDRRRELRGEGDFLQRTGERITSWFRGDRLMRGSREEPDERRGYREDFDREERAMGAERGHRGMGPRGYKRSDDRISEEVHDRLTDDPWLDASNVIVAVKEGEVTLSGVVEYREAKHRAERLIEDLSGVRHVQNNLRVEPPTLSGAGRGFGSSAVEAEMQRNESVSNPAATPGPAGAATEGSTDPTTGRKRQP